MGIKLKSEDEVWDRLATPGVAVATTDLDAIICPVSGSIKAIFVEMGVAGVTGTATFNLKKNQANLFPNATPFTFASGSTVAIYDPTDFAAGTIYSVKKGDVISLDETVVQTTPAKGFSCYILFTRRPNVAVTTASLDPTDTRP